MKDRGRRDHPEERPLGWRGKTVRVESAEGETSGAKVVGGGGGDTIEEERLKRERPWCENQTKTAGENLHVSA